MANAPIRETDLYPPLKSWLEGNGYVVRAEIGHCDIAARKGDDLVLVEMKRAINLDLVLQALRRQRAHASVYAAVPAPKTADRRWRELTRLLKRLEIGLIVVYLETSLPRVQVLFHPVPCTRRRSAGLTRALLAEMAGRSQDANVGGSNRTRLMTAYREQALRTAEALRRLGDASPKALRDIGAPAKAGPILLANHYGWFERVAKGLYRLSADGRVALAAHRDLADSFGLDEVRPEKRI